MVPVGMKLEGRVSSRTMLSLEQTEFGGLLDRKERRKQQTALDSLLLFTLVKLAHTSIGILTFLASRFIEKGTDDFHNRKETWLSHLGRLSIYVSAQIYRLPELKGAWFTQRSVVATSSGVYMEMKITQLVSVLLVLKWGLLIQK